MALPRKKKQEYKDHSQLLDVFKFEYTVYDKDTETTRFFVADVRASSLTEAKHLVIMALRKSDVNIHEWVRTYHHGRDRSWLREGHKNYFPQVLQTRQFDRDTYERLLKEELNSYAV